MGNNSYSYDANGNMRTRPGPGGTNYLKFDAENRLVSISLQPDDSNPFATFVYDGDGKRVKGTINGVTTTYVGNYYEVQGTTTRKYYFAGTQRIAVRENSTLYFFLSDHLGSTAITVDSSGNIYGELRYSAWGETRYNRSSDGSLPAEQRHDTPTNARYTGQMAEPDLNGLYYYGARWYDVYLNRFLSPDSIIPDPSNSLDWDRYSYARNNPVRYSDPSGHLSEDEIMNYYGVSKWDQVLAIFEKGGALEGNWGWLATLRDAEIGDTISLHYGGESLFTGTLVSENGAFYLSNDVSKMSLTSAEKLPWDGYGVTQAPRHPELFGMPVREPPENLYEYHEATVRYPVFKYDPNRFNLKNSVLDVTAVFASLIGGNPLVYGAKAAKTCTDAGRTVSIISMLNSLSVDQNPNSIITSAGGFIPGPVGGGFSLAALFYDLGYYQTY